MMLMRILVGQIVCRDYADERVGAESSQSQRLGVREVRRRSASDASMVHESPSCKSSQRYVPSALPDHIQRTHELLTYCSDFIRVDSYLHSVPSP